MYNLIPRASCLSDIGRPGLSMIGHLNINSIRNKFEMLSMSVAQYVDISMLSETKLGLAVSSMRSHAHMPVHTIFCLAVRSSNV